MKVLVLGGTKFAGVFMVQRLLQRGHEVTVATRGRTPDSFGQQVNRAVVERQDYNSLKAAFDGMQFDVVVDNLSFCSNDVKVLLDAVQTKRYVMTSTVSVYENLHLNMKECEVDPTALQLKWCNRTDFDYGEIKRQAEAALFQAYAHVPSVAVRFPWIFGKTDYTKRLYFYVDNMYHDQAIDINNLQSQLSFIHAEDAGNFLAWCAESTLLGCVNASSTDTVSLQQIIQYTQDKLGKQAIIHKNGVAGTLNHSPSFSLDLSKAQNAGYSFQCTNDWLYSTLDYFVHQLQTGKTE